MNRLRIKTGWRLSPVMTMLTFGGLIVGLFAFSAVANAQSASTAHDQRLITIHDGSTEKSILTQSTSLRKAFAEAGIPVSKYDLVEPGLDAPLTGNTYEINLYRARPVKIVDGNIKKQIMSPYRTSRQIVEHADMKLHDEDRVTLSASTDPVASNLGLTLTIERATPFTLVLYGKKVPSHTMAATVGEMLAEKDIKLGAKDTLSKLETTAIKAGMTVEIWRNGVQTQTRQEKIPMPVREIKDPSKPFGYENIKSAGEPGKKMVTYEVVMKNGKELKRKEIQSVTTKKPRQQVVIVGSKIEGPEAIMAKIRAVASDKGIDAQRVLMIAKCESGFNPNANSGYYKGIFQHDPGYWAGRAAKYGYPGASYYDVDAQIGVSTSMMAGGGWSHWGCDPGPQ